MQSNAKSKNENKVSDSKVMTSDVHELIISKSFFSEVIQTDFLIYEARWPAMGSSFPYEQL